MMDRVVQDDAHVFDWAIEQIETIMIRARAIAVFGEEGVACLEQLTEEYADAVDLQALDDMTDDEWQAWVALPECDTTAFAEV